MKRTSLQLRKFLHPLQRTDANFQEQALFGVYILFFISIIFSLRSISSISTGAILLTSGFYNKKLHKSFLSPKTSFLFPLVCSLLFLVQCSSLLYTQNFSEGAKLLTRSSALVFIPLAVTNSADFIAREKTRLLLGLSSVLIIASFYCVLMAGIKYASGAPGSVFFYHELVKPLSQHAIQFSILLFIALIFLIAFAREQNQMQRSYVLWCAVAILSSVLMLLSSKLITSFYFCCLFSLLLSKKWYLKNGWVAAVVLLAFSSVVLLTSNPVSSRFRSMFDGNAVLFQQKKFSQGTYFNGVQFRLLQWRFTYEIANEQHAWLLGLTPGDAQSFLDRKYIETDMYTGIPATADRGFLGYHTHNQFLQVFLENGILGLLCFLLICFVLVQMAINNKKREQRLFIALLLLYCFTDAPLNTQYGLVLFTFFPAFLHVVNKDVRQQSFKTTPLKLPSIKTKPCQQHEQAT
jgi:O-antigen ligase